MISIDICFLLTHESSFFRLLTSLYLTPETASCYPSVKNLNDFAMHALWSHSFVRSCFSSSPAFKNNFYFYNIIKYEFWEKKRENIISVRMEIISQNLIVFFVRHLNMKKYCFFSLSYMLMTPLYVLLQRGEYPLFWYKLIFLCDCRVVYKLFFVINYSFLNDSGV